MSSATDNTIILTHANHECELYLYTHMVFGVWYSSAHRATVVLANGGAMVPVLESVDEVLEKVTKPDGGK